MHHLLQALCNITPCCFSPPAATVIGTATYLPPDVRIQPQEALGRAFKAILKYANDTPIKPVFGSRDAWSLGIITLQIMAML